MCFNEKTSWVTFIVSILITTMCISYMYNSKHPDKYKVISLLILWQYAALMQIPEALAWRNINNKSSTSMNFNSKLAFVLNTTQPIVAFLIIYMFMKPKLNSFAFGASFASILIYTLFWIYALLFLQNWEWDIKPEKKCSHLNLDWWRNNYYTVIIYLISIMLAGMMLGTKYMIFASIILLGTILSSKVIYKCGVGSVWCWIAASMGLVTTMFHVIDKSLKI